MEASLHPVSLLFQRDEFIFRDSDSGVICFSSEDGANKIYFSKKDENLVSLGKSPFGSLVITKSTDGLSVKSLLNKITKWASQDGTENIIIHHYPDIYSANNSEVLKACLGEMNFEIAYRDVTQFISLHPHELHLNTLRKRKLKRCEQEGFTFKKLTKDHLAEAYPLFIESREIRGYPVTMTEEDLLLMFHKFPENYLLFGVLDKSKIIAACVTVVVNDAIIYYFFTGDSFAYRDHSPVTMLIKGICDYGVQHNFQMVDLGISTDKGVLNEGLYSFKKSFGAKDSSKLTFKKKL